MTNRPKTSSPSQLDRYLYGDSWAQILLILILGLAAAIRLWHVEQSPIPLALDPLYHMADSATLIEGGQVTPWSGFDVTQEISSNPRLLSMLGAGAAVLGIDLLSFYRYGGILFTLLIGVILYLFLKRRLGAWSAVLGVSVFVFAPYVTQRTILTLPENLHLVLFVLALLLLAQWIEATRARDRLWLGLGLVAALTLDFLTHQTAALTLTVVALTLIFHLFERDRGWIGGGLLLLSVFFGLLMATTVPGSWGWHWPIGQLIQEYLGWPTFFLGLAGLFGIAVTLLRGRERWWPIIAGVMLPILGLWFLYRGQAEFIGGIEADRVYLYVALLIAFGAAALVEMGFQFIRPQQLMLLLSSAILIWTLIPRWSAPWPQVFHADEIDGVHKLSQLAETDTLTYSQPIMSWLIRGLGQRPTLGNGFRQTSVNLRDSSVADLVSDAELRAVPRATILFSKYQNDPEFPTRLSDGSLMAMDFSDSLELPGIDPTKFTCLPLLYENNGVLIYELPVTTALPETC